MEDEGGNKSSLVLPACLSAGRKYALRENTSLVTSLFKLLQTFPTPVPSGGRLSEQAAKIYWDTGLMY